MDLRHVIVVTYKLFLILLFCSHSLAIHSWERPGCHILAHTRTVEVDGCLAFNVTTNACRGFCESNAIPSPERTLRANHYHIITSRAECCSIVDTHDVKYTVLCVDGRREFVFKSATRRQIPTSQRLNFRASREPAIVPALRQSQITL